MDTTAVKSGIEKKMAKWVTDMDPGELLSYFKQSMALYHGIQLKMEGNGHKERAVFGLLIKTYGRDAGLIVKWVVEYMDGKDDSGKPVTFFSFQSARKWWTDQVFSEMQWTGKEHVRSATVREGFLDTKAYEHLEPKVISSDLLMGRMLNDAEADRLYASNPQLKSDADDYCPTCAKTGKYYWQGKSNPCDCDEQLQLHKHYLNAGIGVTYQRLSWDDYAGDPNVKAVMAHYVESHLNFVSRGLGMILNGPPGTGKTFAVNMLMKDLIKLGYHCYATTFSSMIEMFTAGWKDTDERRYFEKKVMYSDVLLLDDLGKEMRAKTKLNESTFDHVLRQRTQSGRPTFLTTNLTLAEMGVGYGGSILSLLRENAIEHELTGDDYRPTSGSRLQDELFAGVSRPIF